MDLRLLNCSLEANAVYLHLLVGVSSSQVPGLAEVGVSGLADQLNKPADVIQKAIDELVAAVDDEEIGLVEVDPRPGVRLIRLPGIPSDHEHVASSANNVVGWVKIVKTLSTLKSDVLRRHVDELVAVCRIAMVDAKQDPRLLAAVAQLESFGTKPSATPPPPPPQALSKPSPTNEPEPETKTETETEPDAANAAAHAGVQTGDRPALRLLTALANLHPSTADSSQRWKPKNRAHLAAAEALLATDGDPGWPDEVIDLVTDFSAICAQNREEAKFWLAPRMLDLIPSPKSTSGKSRWETIVSVVGSWRAERRVQEQEAHQRREQGRAAERQRVADRMAELEGLARNGEPAFARQLRESGQKSTPVVDFKACLSAAQEAVADARRGGRDPTLEEIERAVSEAQRPRTK